MHKAARFHDFAHAGNFNGRLIGYKNLSVSALPSMDFPTIMVTANLPGASPETMASTVATPLERKFSTISGVASMSSTSFLGVTQIILQFDLGRNSDGAALDVQSAISAAANDLPPQLSSPPSFQKLNPAEQPVLFVGVSSDTLPLYQVNEYADTLIAQRISTLPGVAQVQIYGAQKYAVRVRVNPTHLAAHNLTLDDIAKSLSQASSIIPGGVISGKNQLITVEVTGQPQDAKQFESLIVSYNKGAAVKLKDVADVEDSVQDIRSFGSLNGKRAVVLAIQRQPGSNTIEVVDSIRKLLPLFRSQIPESVTLTPLFDRSVSIKNAIHDVQFTLILAVGLVILVVFLFFRKAPIVVIPSIAVPLSLIATYGAMQLCGFSINNVSLLALTLSVGFVVDDAIVMVENIIRYMEKGMKGFEAAILGSREIGFTILSMTISLVAVFIPVLFMSGIIGRLFREFAITISMAILISGLISLTLTPMMASRLKIQNLHNAKKSLFEVYFEKLTHLYEHTLKTCFENRRIVLMMTLGLFFLTVAMFKIVPKGFFPMEDAGFVFCQTESDADVSFDAMMANQTKAVEILQNHPHTDIIFSGLGGGRGPLNSGRIFFSFKPQGERPAMDDLLEDLRKKFKSLEGLNVYMQPVQNLSLSARLSKALYQYTLQGSELKELYSFSQKLQEEIKKIQGFVDVSSDLQLKGLQSMLDIDTNLAQSMGISFEEIRSQLYYAFGTAQVGRLYTSSNSYQIIVEVDAEHQQTTENIRDIQLRTKDGKFIELSSIAKISLINAPLSVNHQGQLPSVTLSFNLLPGMSLGDAIEKIHKTEKDIGLPSTIIPSYGGSAQAFQDSLSSLMLLLGLSILVIYIILGMLYESFIHPITILSGLPSAGIGALITLMLLGMDLSVISLIGLVLLVGIVKKNAIMMIDFALDEKSKGESAENAIFNACIIRFRPIMMTTMAAILGTLPIAFGFGEGSEVRQPLGVAVVGGLLTSQILTLYITPIVFLYLDRFSKTTKRSKREA